MCNAPASNSRRQPEAKAGTLPGCPRVPRSQPCSDPCWRFTGLCSFLWLPPVIIARKSPLILLRWRTRPVETRGGSAIPFLSATTYHGLYLQTLALLNATLLTMATQFEAQPPSLSSTEEISEKYGTPAPLAITSFAALKDRIRQHYEICSDYYYSLW